MAQIADGGSGVGEGIADVARARAAASLANLPESLRQLEVGEPWPVIYSRELRELTERTRRNLLG